MSDVIEESIEGMIQFLLDYLNQTDLEIHQATINRLIESLFGNWHSPKQRKLWTIDESITQCTLYGKQALSKNVIIAMFKEMAWGRTTMKS